MSNTPLIEVDKLCIDYPSARVVNNVSFSLGQERLALVGESGSGKSMTARSLMGLVRKPGKVSANKLMLAGENLLNYSPRQWNNVRGKTISMILQDPRYALNPVKTIYQQIDESVKLHQTLSHQDRHQLIIETLLAVGLPEQNIYRYPGELSGGMGQRAMIAIALINNPTILIADEPTSALDAQLRHQILELIITQCEQRKMGLLLISHDLPLVSEYCERVMVMYQGEQVDELSAKTLPEATHPYTRTLWTCRPSAKTYGTELPVLDRTLNFKGLYHAD
ncbi:ATP-binding component of an ABC superfamily dipeptide transporter [Proteus hauseri ATCC 700826]|uniref:ABC-type dipeptide transporter n=1 Tax=Proteus hauseri ATCC 700826 TaxID=1354271 RepID=A0AAJ3HRY1_PROHU|nr:ABC transporter ATP-binding protein [Proteus hauseri]OAT46699.1 ATP-binding component of an ABC superfamily dipeptide transporter [Proteus hauseri ATCC 700826]